MPITNYAELKTAIADWIARSDLTTQIPDFVTFAEARFKRELSGTAFEQDTTLTTDPGGATPGKLDLPSDFVEPLKLDIIETPDVTPLVFQTPVSMTYSLLPGRPFAWCINGASIDLDRPADAVYSLGFRYRSKLELTDSASSNWLLAEYPGLYLAASMAEAYRYTKNPEGAALWDQQAAAQIGGINNTVARSKSGAILTVEGALVGRGYAGYSTLVNGGF